MIKKEVIDMIGLLDEDYFFYGEETDYCFRTVKKGYKIEYADVPIIHIGKATATTEFRIKYCEITRKLFFRKNFTFSARIFATINNFERLCYYLFKFLLTKDRVSRLKVRYILKNFIQ